MISLLERQRSHWFKLHTTLMEQPDLDRWIDEIPGYEDIECNCQKHIYEFVAANPPRFDHWWRWTWEIHNAVNRHLGKPEITWQEACQLYGWV